MSDASLHGIDSSRSELSGITNNDIDEDIETSSKMSRRSKNAAKEEHSLLGKEQSQGKSKQEFSFIQNKSSLEQSIFIAKNKC